MAVERAEHRSGTGGEEAHVSERSELCAVPLAREERRGPAGAARRLAARPAFLWATFLCTSKERWLAPRRGAKALDSASALAWAPQGRPERRPGEACPVDSREIQWANPKAKHESGCLKAKLSLLLRRSELLRLCSRKEKYPREVFFQQPNGWSSTGRAASRRAAPAGPLRSSRARERQNSKTTARSTTTATARTQPPAASLQPPASSLQPATTPKPDPRQDTARRPVASCNP